MAETEDDAPKGEGEAKPKKGAAAEDDREASGSASDDAAEASAAEAGEEGEGEAAAKRVAEALGVGDEDEQAAAPAEAAEEEPAPNRAARRRDEARRRRKKAAGATVKEEDELPKDRNKRAKELLMKRREQAAAGARPANLLPSEVVDDALARSANATLKWVKQNASVLQWVVLAALVGGIGFVVYKYRSDTVSAAAFDELYTGVSDEKGRVLAEDKRSDEEKEVDPARVFKTADARDDAALAAYKKAAQDHPGTGAGILAKLGEAGVLLDKHDWAHAAETYSAVAASTLAGADPDVKGRAVEGIGLAQEGKGDFDAALATYKQLENVDAKGYKQLALYHQGRMMLKKGDKEAAKQLFKKVHDDLQQPSAEAKMFGYLARVNDDELRRLDPSLAPPRPTLGGPKGNSLTPEEAQRYLEKLQEAAKRKGDHH
ncbi:MAG TPA: tetratricopeptide repeat protein [Minicystis sp.]|nr:tetratricopeptide repeat protein [Minicystis sp.]